VAGWLHLFSLQNHLEHAAGQQQELKQPAPETGVVVYGNSYPLIIKYLAMENHGKSLSYHLIFPISNRHF
jgi:hypothetical protein